MATAYLGVSVLLFILARYVALSEGECIELKAFYEIVVFAAK